VGHDLHIPAILSLGKVPQYCVGRKLASSVIDVVAVKERIIPFYCWKYL
jgi:hypothetical protein